ncbi:MAG: cyclopropane-fatty-acyl-phospholipid synthase [Thermoleophilaceae bacterium]|nr:cyclopropane-fatty-acyl-phospholipid synthase [Thermoleophilaceae bacterium]
MSRAAPILDGLVERVSAPDALLVPIVRRSIAHRIRVAAKSPASGAAQFAAARSRGPIAVHTDAANEQHYEVPAGVFELLLGPRLKYSSALYEDGVTGLAEAEEAMLALTCQRAGIEDGMEILELGCGWGSLTLWMAEKYPNARVTAISNSNSQREFIQARAAERGLEVEVQTMDVQNLALAKRFDRVVSVEMFEHVRNHAALLERVAEHLEPGGALFVHVFAHRAHGYEFEDTWMTRRFFQGGVMPVHGWLGHLKDPPLAPVKEWWLDGTHYARTADAWLDNFDAHRDELHEVFTRENGPGQAAAELRAWRLFFIACREIFAAGGGEEYGVSHTLLRTTPE